MVLYVKPKSGCDLERARVISMCPSNNDRMHVRTYPALALIPKGGRRNVPQRTANIPTLLNEMVQCFRSSNLSHPYLERTTLLHV